MAKNWMVSEDGSKERLNIKENLRFMLKNWFEWDKKSLWLLAYSTPSKIALPALTALIPKLMLDAIAQDWLPAKLIVLIAAMSVLLALLSWIEPNLNEKLRVSGQLARMKYRIMSLRKIMRIDYETLESPEGSQKLAKAKDFSFGGRWSPGEDFFAAVKDFISSAFGLITFAALLTRLSPILLAIIAVGCGLEIWGFHLGNQNMFKYHRNARPNYARIEYINRVCTDAETGKDVRLYNLQPWFMDFMHSVVMSHRKLVGKLIRQDLGTKVTLGAFAGMLREGAAYFFLVQAVLSESITVPDFLFYFGIVTGFSAWLISLTWQWSNIQRCCKACQHFRDYMDLPDNAQAGNLSVGDSIDEIEFRDVSFTYKGSIDPVLKDVSFTIRKGEKLAIVGENGAGKTTLIKLLCGFYPPTKGQILLNGIDIREYDRENYYKIFGAVFQDFTFLPVSVSRNVTIAPQEDEDAQRLEAALRNAGLWDKLNALPDGLESPMVKDVWEGAVNFSGGERQRLLLARALYKNAPVLILDEPTAALDPIAENRLYEKYSRFTQGKTSFFISHRIASTRFCERIFYMADGKIAEEGNHEQLLANQGAYYKMFETQSYYYRKELGTEDIGEEELAV
ncbi:MAG: ABC transporter ATP-binding protein/permease [Oscillospiraceae bacterium]|nr:ABC transporter ATP-binding protein/permease [Oscillospiraceae bacterium]